MTSQLSPHVSPATTARRPPLVMLIEDHADGARAGAALVNAGIVVRHVCSEEEAAATLNYVAPDLLLVGWHDDGFDGRAILARLKIKHPISQGIPAIIMAGQKVSEFTRYNLSRLEVKLILEKPVATTVLSQLIIRILNQGAFASGKCRPGAVAAAAPQRALV